MAEVPGVNKVVNAGVKLVEGAIEGGEQAGVKLTLKGAQASAPAIATEGQVEGASTFVRGRKGPPAASAAIEANPPGPATGFLAGLAPAAKAAAPTASKLPLSTLFGEEALNRAAAQTHAAWLGTSGAQPGIRFVNDVATSLKKAGIQTDDPAAFLATNNMPCAGNCRTFAFPTDANLRVTPSTDEQGRLLRVLQDNKVDPGTQIRGNNLPAVTGYRGPVIEALEGRSQPFIKDGDGYADAAQRAFQQTSTASPQGAASIADLDAMASKIDAYRRALRGVDPNTPLSTIQAALEKDHPEAHALMGRIHDAFVGQRLSSGAYMDPAQVVPYERLTAQVADLDIDPALALVQSARTTAAAQAKFDAALAVK